MPQWSIRNVLLVMFMFTWSVYVIALVIRGERLSGEEWAGVAIGLGAIAALFRPPPPPDQGGGSPS